MSTPTQFLLERLRALSRDISQAAPSDDELVDVAGELAELVNHLRATQVSWLSEVAPLAVGDRYRSIQSKPMERSYNTDAILAAAAGKASSPLHYYLAKDAVRLTWRWTQLKTALHELDVPLVVAAHEITDGDPDGYMVGEVPKPRTRLEPINEGRL
jgi:hypothetical protein